MPTRADVVLVAVPTKLWTRASFEAWLVRHGYRADGIEERQDLLWARQSDYEGHLKEHRGGRGLVVWVKASYTTSTETDRPWYDETPGETIDRILGGE